MTPLPNIATGNRKVDAKALDAWLDTMASAGGLTIEQARAAATVQSSFKTIELNKNNAAEMAHAQKLHDRDVAKLIALLGAASS